MTADLVTANTVSDLLNYAVSDDEDPFADIDATKTGDNRATQSPRAAKRKADDGIENDGLGLDEEVKITKKRKPIAKLDERRLLSQSGIPKIREVARSDSIARKLRFKGKGHEFSDAARLLSYYQLWLDNLYPRAKFADGLQLVEKVGHSKRMQIMRKEWIDQAKPGYARDKALRKALDENDDMNGDHESAGVKVQEQKLEHTSVFGNGDESNDMFFSDPSGRPEEHDIMEPDDDELDALLAAQPSEPKSVANNIRFDSEGEDDLDALLAEEESRRNPPLAPLATGERKNEDEDELDAFLGNPHPPGMTKVAATDSRNTRVDEDNEAGLDALLAEQEVRDRPDFLTPGLLSNLNSQKASEKTAVRGVESLCREGLKDDLTFSHFVSELALPEISTTALPTRVDEGNLPSAPPPPNPPEMDNMLSSSPLPNEVEDLDALFDEHEQQNEKKTQEGETQDSMLLSSPIPNEEVEFEGE